MNAVTQLTSKHEGCGVVAVLCLFAAACSPDTSSSGGSVSTGAAGTPASSLAAAGAPGTPSSLGKPATPTGTSPSTMTAASGATPAAAASATPATSTTTPAAMPSTPLTGGALPMAGSAATPPSMAGTAGAAAVGGEPASPEMLPMTTGAAPPLPEIMGACPEFKNGTTIMVAGHRSIQIQVGEANKNGPVLFYWHGTGSSAAESARFPGNSEIVSSGGIVAAFNGSQSSGTGRDCSGTGAHNMADFEAADQIVACAVKNHGTDPRRIYSTGCSAGGLQTGCMAMVRSSYLAAAAPNSGGIVGAQPWQDMHSPAIFTMHGGASDMVIVTFSQTSASLDMAAKQHGSFVVNCDHGGGHCAAPQDLQKAAWQFMKDHPWGVSASPWMSAIPSGVPSYCKVF